MRTEQATYERERHALAHLMFGGEEPATGELDAAWGRTVRAFRAWEAVRIADAEVDELVREHFADGHAHDGPNCPRYGS
jgi:hypothetical protein